MNNPNLGRRYWCTAARMLAAEPGPEQTVTQLLYMCLLAVELGRLIDTPADWGWPAALECPQ
jgi:hypothetical protein